MGLTQSIDHDEKLWRSRGEEEGRAVALFEGRLATIKQNVLDGLVAHAATTD